MGILERWVENGGGEWHGLERVGDGGFTMGRWGGCYVFESVGDETVGYGKGGFGCATPWTSPCLSGLQKFVK